MADEATSTTDNTDAAAQTSDDSAAATKADATEATESTSETQDTADLGEAGKKAIDRMKADRNKYRDELNTLKPEVDSLKAELAKLQGKEAEYQAAQESQKVKDEAIAAANQRILKAEIRAAAAGKLNDPADALAYLDLDSFEVGEDGEVDSDAIGAALADLTTKKPYLAVQDGKRFQGDADAGTRNESSPAQWSQSDLDKATPEQISEAKKKGLLDNLLGRK